MKISLNLDIQEIDVLLSILHIQAQMQLNLSDYRKNLLSKVSNELKNIKELILISNLGLLKQPKLFLPASN